MEITDIQNKNIDFINVIHFSDTHFGNYIFRPTVITKCHDFRMLKALSDFISTQEIDIIFLTGDVVTGGDDNAFQHARNFVFQKINTPQGTIGLGLNPDDSRIFIVPGNHDYYPNIYIPVASSIDKFDQYFPEFKTPYVKFFKKGHLRITIFGLDSVKNASGSIAKGRLDEKDLDWLIQTCRQLETNRYVKPVFSSQEYKESLKIVLIHHHLYLPKNRNYNYFNEIKNRKEVLKIFLKCDIKMIFYGHEHTHFVEHPSYDCQLDKRIKRELNAKGYDTKKRFIACMASTASQANAKENSLWVLKISSSSLLCQRYYFENNSFIPSTKSIQLKMAH
jgi:3',5'-cyclic AMP phosphodiesterase CpdA